MANVIQLFGKDKTKPEHDTMRQVSRSETPSGLTESIRHIMSPLPQPTEWHHLCPCAGMVNTVLKQDEICPDCFVTQDGVHHGPPGGAA